MWGTPKIPKLLYCIFFFLDGKADKGHEKKENVDKKVEQPQEGDVLFFFVGGGL